MSCSRRSSTPRTLGSARPCREAASFSGDRGASLRRRSVPRGEPLADRPAERAAQHRALQAVRALAEVPECVRSFDLTPAWRGARGGMTWVAHGATSPRSSVLTHMHLRSEKARTGPGIGESDPIRTNIAQLPRSRPVVQEVPPRLLKPTQIRSPREMAQNSIEQTVHGSLHELSPLCLVWRDVATSDRPGRQPGRLGERECSSQRCPLARPLNPNGSERWDIHMMPPPYRGGSGGIIYGNRRGR